MTTTKIEWTDKVWNPVTGCTKVSAGCKYCYAERMWTRLSAKNMPYEGREFTDIKAHPDRLGLPLKWRKPSRVFVNSMSDLFHEDVPYEFIHKVFAVMGRCQQHTFQVLTKRPERMLDYWQSNPYQQILSEADKLQYRPEGLGAGISDPNIHPIPNVWLGVSVENQETADERIPILLETPAAVRFLSIEPLIDQVSLHKWVYSENKPDWVIVGGESGPKARPCSKLWISGIVGQCKYAGIPVFVKQLGSFCLDHKVTNKGQHMNEWPEYLRVQEMPL